MTPQTVALRWLINQGTFPVVTSRWPGRCWSQFGYEAWSVERRGRAGLDGQHLFVVASFLDADDVAALDLLA